MNDRTGDDHGTDDGRQRPNPGNAVNGGVHGGTVNQFGNIRTAYFHGPDAPPPEPSRELPPDVEPWVNRTDPLREMRKSITDQSPRHAPRVMVVHGTDAVGKTAFVVRCTAPLHDEEFPNGSYYVDVAEDSADGTVSVHDLLGRLLESLDDDPGKWPESVSGLARRWRRLTSHRRMLLVLDNLEDAAVLRQVLPNGRGVTVVVVSRYNHLDFVAMGAQEFEIKPLDRDNGVELLRHFCGAERVEAEPEAASELFGLSHGRPQLIRVIGASLKSAPDTSLSQCLAQIDSGAGPISDHIKTAATAIVTHSLSHNVSATERNLLRDLSRFPGREFSTALASWLHRSEAVDLLRQLAEAQLVIPVGSDRWRLTNAVAEYDFGDDSPNALERILDWYLRSARLCDATVMGRNRLLINRVSDADLAAPFLVQPGDVAAASHWLFTELHTLSKLQKSAFDTGGYATVWALEESLWAVYQSFRPLDAWRLTAPLAIDAAVRDGNLRAEARMRDQYANLLSQLGDLDAAAVQAEQALTLARRAENPRLLASAIEFRGLVHKHQGDFDTAIEHFTEALAINRELGLDRARAIQHRLIGECRLALGDLDQARAELDTALAIFAAGESRHHTAHTLAALAVVTAATGDVTATDTALTTAASAFTEAGACGYIPGVYEQCGDAFADRAPDTAHRYWTIALEHHRKNQNDDGDAARALLDKLS